jgi:nicotinamide-nucleotide amidase
MIEILTIGTELLLGSTVDTNGAWLGEHLAAEGIRVARRTTVADDALAIRDALTSALRRTGLVICTGGLGPTPDDFTKSIVASVYGRAMYLDAAWLAEVEQRWRARGVPMPSLNRNQAEVPEGARILPNARGTAPGLVLEDGALGVTILLPGVPAEMRWLARTHVLPMLRERLAPLTPIRSRTIRTTGIAESAIAELLTGMAARLAPLTLAWLPTGIGEDVRVTCWGEATGADAEAALDAAEREIAAVLGPWVYGRDHDDLAEVLGAELRARSLSVAVAESCTGGLVAERITDVPGSSGYFLGAIVSYADAAKQALLGVPPDVLADHGAVSEVMAEAMARGARAALGADCAISVTGIAGPGGGSAEKPVGTVWIACAVGDQVHAQLFRFTGERKEIRARAAQAALATLLRRLCE